MVIGKKSRLQKLPTEKNIMIGGTRIDMSNTARNIGAVLDCQLDMKAQISNISRSCWYQIYNIGNIRKYLFKDSTSALVHAIVTSKLNNYNSLLFGLQNSSLLNLQMVQNNAARLIVLQKKYEHITPVLKQLHWLPVEIRTDYKICLLTYKCLHQMVPLYLQDLITPYRSRRDGLRLETLHQ